jgi:hypothetical protein
MLRGRRSLVPTRPAGRPSCGSFLATAGDDGVVTHDSTGSVQSFLMPVVRRPNAQGLFVAWGMENGQFTPEFLARSAAAASFSWLALQVEGNSRHFDSVRRACQNEGVAFGVWEADPTIGSGAEYVARAQAGFYIAQAEGPRDWQAITHDFRSHYPAMPAAVVTNFGGIEDPATCVPLLEAKFACLTECYIGQNPMATPENLDFQARYRGWKSSQPVLGLYNGITFDDYTLDGLLGWSVWLAEFLFQ